MVRDTANTDVEIISNFEPETDKINFIADYNRACK